MDSTTLRALLTETYSVEEIEALARTWGVVDRQSKIRLYELVISLVLTARTSSGGRQADALRHYRELTGDRRLHRGAFYARFCLELELLLKELLAQSLSRVHSSPILLPPALNTVHDWVIADSTTVKLRDALRLDYLGTGDYSALKVHKLFSIGRHNLLDYCVSDARDHDARFLKVTEAFRGLGVLVDLGYVSHAFLLDCEQYEVSYVVRLKEKWNVSVKAVVTGEAAADAFKEGPFDFASALANQRLQFKNGVLDLDVSLRVEGRPHPVRLVVLEIPGKGVCAFLTNLVRERYPAELVGLLYRLRWEIEKDNKLNKSDEDLDELDGRKVSSVHIMLYASLLGSLVVNRIVHHDHQELFATWEERPRAPLHARLVALALASCRAALTEALATQDPEHRAWQSVFAVVEGSGRDPNWRRRPSVLDVLLGFTAPPGRPRDNRREESRPLQASDQGVTAN
jgi:hypothetical protein